MTELLRADDLVFERAGEPVFEPQVAVEFIPAFHGCGAAIEIADVAIYDVVTAQEHGDVELRLMAKETGTPHPRFAIGDLPGQHDLAFQVTQREVDLLERMKQ